MASALTLDLASSTSPVVLFSVKLSPHVSTSKITGVGAKIMFLVWSQGVWKNYLQLLAKFKFAPEPESGRNGFGLEAGSGSLPISLHTYINISADKAPTGYSLFSSTPEW